MGLKDPEALRKFCQELSSDQPSPGGGTAAAGAGAMAASLLVMVCAITARSKKHESDRPELEALKASTQELSDALVIQARDDARSYDEVVDAARRKRAEGGKESEERYTHAVVHAAQVPLETIRLCVEVLKKADRVAQLGIKSASSDVGVAVLLAEAGVKGASMNVNINISELGEDAFTRSAKAAVGDAQNKAQQLAKSALSRLSGIHG